MRQTSPRGEAMEAVAPPTRTIGKLLLKGAPAHGYGTHLWTLPRVAEVIERHFGVSYHPHHVWRVLRQMGWSCQKPERKAREADDEAIERWRRVDWEFRGHHT